MTKLKLFFMLLFSSVLIVSCVPFENNNSIEDSNNSNDDFSKNFGNTAIKDFLGQVVDENNDPIQNASITIGTSTVQTDVNGVFIIKGANVYEKFAYITAKKTGFINSSRAIVPTDGTNNIKIMMLSGAVVSTVTSGVSSEVTLLNGAKVVFDGNFKTETGTAYSGSVSVIMHHLDPADPQVADKMPGMLFAQNSAGEARMLETYGMINVELKGSAGQKLQITNTAQLEMPITSTQQATAPTTIPLWYFDETLGYWKEEGSATKVGNKYVGTVAHFTWWNADAPYPTVTLTVKVVDSAGNPLCNAGISVSRPSDIYHRIGFSDEKGQISGLIPTNESLVINVYDNCGGIVKTSSIGPINADTKLPNIVITDGTVHSTLVQGSIIKCDNTNVTNGYVLLKYANLTSAYIVTTGNFSFRNLTCASNNSFTLEGFDFDNLQTTGKINYKFALPITEVGNLKTCNTISQFVSYQVDTNPVKYFVNVNAYSVPGVDKFYLTATTTVINEFVVLGYTQTPGIYTATDFDMEIYKSPSQLLYINSTTLNTLTYNLNSYGNVGQYVDMTFYGTYTEAGTTIIHTIHGVAHVLRSS